MKLLQRISDLTDDQKDKSTIEQTEISFNDKKYFFEAISSHYPLAVTPNFSILSTVCLWNEDGENEHHEIFDLALNKDQISEAMNTVKNNIARYIKN